MAIARGQGANRVIDRVVEDCEPPDASWLRLGAEGTDVPDWLRTTIVPARESLLFLQWLEERILLARQEELRAGLAQDGLVGALALLDQFERSDWLTYRGRLGERFIPAREAEQVYRGWGYAF